MEEQALIFETLQQIDVLLDGLAGRVRSVFLLSQLEGLTYEQIALRVGISERTARRYVAQGLERCLSLMD